MFLLFLFCSCLYCVYRVPSGVCIYIPGCVYIPFSEIGYVKGIHLHQKVCKIASTDMFTVDGKPKQAGAELGQAQLKLRFDLTLFFFENLLSLYPALKWKDGVLNTYNMK